MKRYWIWLSMLDYVGPVLQKKLLLSFLSPQAVFEATKAELENIRGLDKRARSSILENRCLKKAEEILKRCQHHNIHLLHYFHDLYPTYAKNLKESPILLFYKGTFTPVHTAIGIVGSRRCTRYGRKIAEEVARQLSQQQVPIVSGFAKGIDSYAQASCLEHGGYPIVFFANGVDICYPKEQWPLYQKTLEKGGVIFSQYPPGTPAKPKQFLQRNALISAWSTELIVVEAGEKSGSLWTANFANKQGKLVYAVPHPLHVPEGLGVNQLLAQGAKPYLGIESLQSVRNNLLIEDVKIMEEEHPILSLLTISPQSISYLKEQLNTTEHKIINELLALELEGKIMLRGNMAYRV